MTQARFATEQRPRVMFELRTARSLLGRAPVVCLFAVHVCVRLFVAAVLRESVSPAAGYGVDGNTDLYRYNPPGSNHDWLGLSSLYPPRAAGVVWLEVVEQCGNGAADRSIRVSAVFHADNRRTRQAWVVRTPLVSAARTVLKSVAGTAFLPSGETADDSIRSLPVRGWPHGQLTGFFGQKFDGPPRVVRFPAARWAPVVLKSSEDTGLHVMFRPEKSG